MRAITLILTELVHALVFHIGGLRHELQVEEGVVQDLEVHHLLGGRLFQLDFDLLVGAEPLFRYEVSHGFKQADFIIQTGRSDDQGSMAGISLSRCNCDTSAWYWPVLALLLEFNGLNECLGRVF